MSEDDFIAEFDDFVKALEEPVLGLSPYAQYRVMKLAAAAAQSFCLRAGRRRNFSQAIFIILVICVLRITDTGKNFHSVSEKCSHLFRTFKNAMPFGLFAFMLMPSWLKHSLWKIFVINGLITICSKNSTGKGSTSLAGYDS
jgi:asparagine synthase (glutamine-hydrolysing)